MDLMDLTKSWLRKKGCSTWWNWEIADERPGGELDEAAEHWLQQYHSFQEHLEASCPQRWGPPTMEQHELVLVDRDELLDYGPTNVDLPGTVGGIGDRPFWEAYEALCEKGLIKG